MGRFLNRKKHHLVNKIMLIYVIIVLTFGTTYADKNLSVEPEVIRTKNGHYLS